MNGPLYALALLAGLGISVQAGLNGTLRQVTGSAWLAALISFCVGSLALSAFLLITRAELPSKAVLAHVPTWAWLGGLFGALYVATAALVAPRLGASTLLALTLVGQLTASLVLDHFGWLGFAQHSLSVARLAGVLLLATGVLLITR